MKVRMLLLLLAAMLTYPSQVFAIDIKAPWTNNSTAWYWTSGWHSGSYKGGKALDFAPGSNRTVLSSQPGKIIGVCKGLRSYNLVVRSDSGNMIEYWHLKLSHKPWNIMRGQNVKAGQVLGVTSGAHKFDGCGVSTGHHIHFVFDSPDPVHSIEGWRTYTTNKLSKGTSKLNPGATFKSSNQPNFGDQVDCWEADHVFLVDNIYDWASLFPQVCYADRRISTYGNHTIVNGHKQLLLAGRGIRLGPGFRTTTYGDNNSSTRFVARIATI